MASYNKVLLMGNLTRDIEIKQFSGGTSVGKLGLAVNEKYKDRNDQWVERVNFIDCDVFGRKAEVMAQYLTKGSPVFIEGKLRLDTWQDKNDGSNRSKLKVVIDNFQFVGGGQGGGGNQGGAWLTPPATPSRNAARAPGAVPGRARPCGRFGRPSASRAG